VLGFLKYVNNCMIGVRLQNVLERKDYDFELRVGIVCICVARVVIRVRLLLLDRGVFCFYLCLAFLLDSIVWFEWSEGLEVREHRDVFETRQQRLLCLLMLAVWIACCVKTPEPEVAYSAFD